MEQNKREKIKYFVIQKLVGLLLLIVSILSVLISSDGTAAVLLTPIALYTIFTRKLVITNTYYFEHEDDSEWRN